ncbi:plasmid pRiA4b ORF-3 family protein [Melghirimyces algeriensis]|uniref:PRiA4b ORF-3-like protein n=1 Tax=Melghirimyces algeriensis TaxID=910412 RepID=A0A521F8M7_9BACL|nr:plasmid pRiA4b ORF-3 family protein [Melghirimyces algeriensis]SMO92486.1 pRiA4b ORF-3-like protein [Melghirimyces algeriensis]
MIYQLKVSLKNVHPPVWRRVQTYSQITFAQLHQVIQVIMEWEGTHLHIFQCRKNQLEWSGQEEHHWVLIGDPEVTSSMDWPCVDQTEEILEDWLSEENSKCFYINCLKDGFFHEILLEEILPAQPGVAYPICIQVEGVPPAESLAEDGTDDRTLTDQERLKQMNVQLQDRLQGFFEHGEVEKTSQEQWMELFQVAVHFGSLAPWEWMMDDQVFAVYDALSGQVGYCSVRGGMGDVFGLAVYVGNEGLKSLYSLKSEQEDRPDLEQRCLLVSFEDQQNLESEDYYLMKEIGFYFQEQHHQCPVFRSFLPGAFPWFLNRDEVVFLTHVLQQAIEVCRRVREGLHLMPDETGHFFLRVSSMEKEGLVWRDGVLEVEEVKQYELHVNELELHKLSKRLEMREQVLEFDYFYLPDAVQEEENQRPYFPCVSLWLDDQLGRVIGFELMKREHLAERIQNQLMALIQKLDGIPQAILIKKRNVSDILFPIARKLGIEIHVSNDLSGIRRAQQELVKMMKGVRIR